MRFPKYQKMKKDRSGHFFIFQIPIPIKRIIRIRERIVVMGLNKDFEIVKS